ncbi:MAG: hypothetical protein AMXMBFR48_29410 [Ignavibacteriales bacterium]
MRPVRKWLPSDPGIQPPINDTYNPYSDAKPDLSRNLDDYCSFCERPANDEAVHVEHIQPKGLPQYSGLKYLWSNFLLSCARCNGKDNKSNRDVVFGTVHLPHLNNTFLSISYGEGGVIKVNPKLRDRELSNAVALVKLVGLDKRPGSTGYRSKDKRWDRRREVWEIAIRYFDKYNNDTIDEQTILDLAKGYGFWSVWYSVFLNKVDVKKLLLSEFRGTASECFDNDYNPIPRNPGNPEDTI